MPSHLDVGVRRDGDEVVGIGGCRKGVVAVSLPSMRQAHAGDGYWRGAAEAGLAKSASVTGASNLTSVSFSVVTAFQVT